MNSSVATRKDRAFTESQRAALITLLSDDDPAVWQMVRRKIVACGQEAVRWLRPYSLSEDPITRRRVRGILNHLERQAADGRFLRFCLHRGEEFDAEEAIWLLVLTRYPDINVGGYQALLDSYAGDLRGLLHQAPLSRKTLQILNRHLFGELGFHGNELDYYHPENTYLNRVLDRRTGNPIGLCMVYLFVARRLGLPIVGIAMPGHFICRFQSSTETVYIDVFNRGRLLTKADCVRYLQQSSYGCHHGLLSPASPRRILLRMCSNLHQIYLQLDSKTDSARIQRYVAALTR